VISIRKLKYESLGHSTAVELIGMAVVNVMHSRSTTERRGLPAQLTILSHL